MVTTSPGLPEYVLRSRTLGGAAKMGNVPNSAANRTMESGWQRAQRRCLNLHIDQDQHVPDFPADHGTASTPRVGSLGKPVCEHAINPCKKPTSFSGFGGPRTGESRSGTSSRGLWPQSLRPV